MKKIILGIIIGVTLSTGSIALASNKVKLIMVPEFIGGYKTVDLLKYVAEQRSKPVQKENQKETVTVVNPPAQIIYVQQPQKVTKTRELLEAQYAIEKPFAYSNPACTNQDIWKGNNRALCRKEEEDYRKKQFDWATGEMLKQ